ncbi:MAG: pantoate--beta-alanine ligase [Saprospiraceae bacterium]|nr:pantoate--beta-alanine ligase [Saprospiraceae bacterium]
MILVVEGVPNLIDLVQRNKENGVSIGFVPTMGALHKGHLSLVRKAKKENDLVIVSIFVNPTQFNDKKDLEKYPRTLESDISLLLTARADVVFTPASSEIYPEGDQKGNDIDLGGLDSYMEGAFRPGHFKGVAQVVKRLLDIVTPDKLYMGQKDFQQFTIIAHMIRTLKIQTDLVVCRILREANGLAMSSRNERLTKETREKAGLIYKTLQSVKKYQNTKSVKELEDYGMKRLNIAPFIPEYFTICDGNTLKPIQNINDTSYAVACVAVWGDGIRLIDNIILKK